MRTSLTRLALFSLAAIGGVASGVGNVGSGVERAFAELRHVIRSQPASGTVQIVEIDARSIAAIDRWPWPRGHHAALIDRLHQAGAAVIAFDIDFSSRSSPEDDRRLALALADAGGSVILPTFRQRADASGDSWLDSLPQGAIRNDSVLAAVSIATDSDGRVRRAPLGTFTANTPRPSLSAAIAGRSGVADESFPIDFAIEPASIPRHSFVDILNGKSVPASLRGAKVLVGATAIELGDRYAVPRYGVIPGVVIQALAAETLLRAVPVSLGWVPALLAAMAMAGVILCARRRWSLALSVASTPSALFGVSVLLAGRSIDVAIVPALVTALIASGAAVALRSWRAYQRSRALDAPSGLPNRVAMLQQLAAGPAFGVAALRIGNFEQLAAGLDASQLGALLQRVAERVALVTHGSAVHRIDDRCLAWCVAPAAEPAIDDAFSALRTMMIAPIEVGGRRVDVALSGGLAGAEDGFVSTINNAAMAADRAQAAGATWHRYRADEKAGLARDLSLMGELDEAIERGDIHVVYQPKLRLNDDRIAGVEALVRWNHATRGFMPPDTFIPLAERNDRIGPLTLHVLSLTIADLCRWRDAGTPITGAINLSANLVEDPQFMATLAQDIVSSDIDPALLIIEVTESAAMRDPSGAAAALAALRKLGVAISMDDYGTGQSTLSYLQQLPLDELKIDRSFVQHADKNHADAVLVRSTITLAHDLGLRVVAEGVEDEACLALLRSVHCDYAQGYHISRPVPAPEIARLLSSQIQDAAA